MAARIAGMTTPLLGLQPGSDSMVSWWWWRRVACLHFCLSVFAEFVCVAQDQDLPVGLVNGVPGPAYGGPGHGLAQSSEPAAIICIYPNPILAT